MKIRSRCAVMSEGLLRLFAFLDSLAAMYDSNSRSKILQTTLLRQHVCIGMTLILVSIQNIKRTFSRIVTDPGLKTKATASLFYNGFLERRNWLPIGQLGRLFTDSAPDAQRANSVLG
ncbi:hypothetical protein GGS20DRAFT_545613 [Poronia punctata]|nr:hypothetical protein GGS20DRAFT_545613 [Poronia punctata]